MMNPDDPYVLPSQENATAATNPPIPRDPNWEFIGYLELVKTMAVNAVKEVFDESYPTTDFQNLYCSVEYPLAKNHYPGVWVDYQDTAPLEIIGVNHEEWGDGLLNPPPPDPVNNTFEVPHTRWKFGGYISYTIAALTSWERDRIYGELVRVISSRGTVIHNEFKRHIETNPFVAVNMNTDRIEPQGNNAAPGTPWGTDDLIYERTINMEIIGEFATDTIDGVLIPLEQVKVVAEIDASWPAQYVDPDVEIQGRIL